MLKGKKIELFCGTGGVGKTTLATARALSLSRQGNKVLLITIDPAKRLKQILNIKDENAGEVSTISHSQIDENDTSNGHLYALLMSPTRTLKRIAETDMEETNEKGETTGFENPVLKILSRPNGGMNEIMAIIEVQHQLKRGNYDVIVLDTPPGKHFIDFLEASNKIKNFFDKSFVDIFRYFGKTFEKGEAISRAPRKLFKKILNTGVKKLLSYLEHVTGPHFVEIFVDAIVTLYRNREAFLEALNFQESLKSEKVSNWFLVTSVDQDKLQEAGSFRGQAISFMHEDSYLTVNKSLSTHLEQWNPTDTGLSRLKSSMLNKEQRIDEFASKNFDKVLYFPEVLSNSPAGHVTELSYSWEKS